MAIVYNGIRYEQATRAQEEVYALDFRTLRLTERELWGMEERTRRKIIQQVMFICTETTFYCIGANSIKDTWTMVATDVKHLGTRDSKGRQQVIQYNNTTQVVDEWR